MITTELFPDMSKSNISKVSNQEIIENFNRFQEVIQENKFQLANQLAIETGKPIKYCQKEVDRCVETLSDGISFLKLESDATGVYNGKFQARWYRKSLPIGTVLVFTPFSSAFNSFIQKMVASIIYKNNFVCKPSPRAIQSSKKLFEILTMQSSDNVKGALGLILAEDNNEAQNILKYGNYDCLLFVGKSSTARKIKGLIGRKRAVFETGSSALAYVSKSANVDEAAKNVVNGAFGQSGMRCVATKNVYVHKSIKEMFIEKVLIYTQRMKFGEATNPNTDVGPLLEQDTLLSLQKYIYQLKEKGYRVAFGGETLDNILMPTVLIDDNNSNYRSTKEAYGPILSIHETSHVDKIPDEYLKRSSINIAIYSNDYQEINEFVDICKYSGAVFINRGPTERIDYLPFGGLMDENEGKEGIGELKKHLTNDQIIYECF